ncbi:MAG: aldo/keto reductase, partial [Bacteroidales bacterium]|nr:aldo/keto reductase [Bacteroidales bacterium]
PIEKLAIQFAISNPAITTTLFSSANPENVLRNIRNAEAPMDQEMVKEVQEIIGDQMGVRWNNS